MSAPSKQVAPDGVSATSTQEPAAEPGPAVGRRAEARREQSAEDRLDAADRRDELAQDRDVGARARDDAADLRNRAQADRDAALDRDDGDAAITGSEIMIRAAGRSKRDARRRAQAAEQRQQALDDLHGAAEDREQAARERLHALVDRELLARQIEIAETDMLTGARTRAAGLVDLDHELDRCRRASGRLVVAYADVVGLKAVNDSDGHAAGDEMLKRTVTVIREHLRSYDLAVRLGGDEFLFVMSDMTLLDARGRFEAIDAALLTTPAAGAISTGIADLAPGETSSQLIARADDELIASRLANRSARPARPAATARSSADR